MTLPLGYSFSKNALSEQNSSLLHVTASPSTCCGRGSWPETKAAHQHWVYSGAQFPAIRWQFCLASSPGNPSCCGRRAGQGAGEFSLRCIHENEAVAGLPIGSLLRTFQKDNLFPGNAVGCLAPQGKLFFLYGFRRTLWRLSVPSLCGKGKNQDEEAFRKQKKYTDLFNIQINVHRNKK